MPVADLTAGYLPIIGEPGDPVALTITVPAGYESGTWTANVWSDTRKDTVRAAAAMSVVGQAVMPSWSAAQSAGLVTAGSTKFAGYWELDRTVSGVPRTVLKGPYILDPNRRRNGSGSQAATVTINSNAVTVAGGELTLADVSAAVNVDATRPVKLTYRTVAVSGVATDGWYLHDGSTVDLTDRPWPAIWEGTAAQIPAQGTGDEQLQVGDLAVARTATL